MNNRNPKYFIKTATITGSGGTSSTSFNGTFDDSYKYVVGVDMILSNVSNNEHKGSTFSLRIDSEEVFPDSYFPAEKIMSDLTVCPNKRFFTQGFPFESASKAFKALYTDGGNYSSNYTVTLIFWLDNDPDAVLGANYSEILKEILEELKKAENPI